MRRWKKLRVGITSITIHSERGEFQNSQTEHCIVIIIYVYCTVYTSVCVSLSLSVCVMDSISDKIRMCGVKTKQLQFTLTDQS